MQIHESVAMTIENDNANFPKDCYYSYSITSIADGEDSDSGDNEEMPTLVPREEESESDDDEEIPSLHRHIDQTNMREYHVDTHPILLKYINGNTNKKYGGNLSVRRNLNENPLIIIGQDESTFHQFIFSKKQWKGPQGHNFLIPKSEGEIYMVSGLSCQNSV